MGLEDEYQAALDKLQELDLYTLPQHEISVSTAVHTTCPVLGSGCRSCPAPAKQRCYHGITVSITSHMHACTPFLKTLWEKKPRDHPAVALVLQVFETTIRIIGGLLSAYSLRSHMATLPGNHTGSPAKDGILLEKAVQLAEMLMPVSAGSNRGLEGWGVFTRSCW
jgi:hypothetical protein